MHVCQPLDLVMGLLMFPLGLIGLCLDLRRVFSRTFANTYGDWRSVGLSVWFLFAGPAHFSRAFDPPHQTSHRTNLLEMIEVVVLAVIILAAGAAWVIRRCQTTTVLEQRAARGSRGRFEEALAKVGAVPPDEQDRLYFREDQNP